MSEPPLFRKVDCLALRVTDLDAALIFYGTLGHELIWRTPTGAGLRLPDSEAELVLQTERPGPETDLTVDAVAPAVERFVAAGGRVVVPPFDIAIGRCAVVADPWDNHLVLLDNSKGRLVTDAAGKRHRRAVVELFAFRSEFRRQTRNERCMRADPASLDS